MSKLVKFYGDGFKGRNFLYKFICNSQDDAYKCLERMRKLGIKNIKNAWWNGYQILYNGERKE